MALTLVEQVRLAVGDSSCEIQILRDEDYESFLAASDNSVNRAARMAARSILFALSGVPTRERTGDIEVWRNWAMEYRKALELFIKYPLASGTLGTLIPYASGISVSDMQANDCNPDNVRPKVPPKTTCDSCDGCGCNRCLRETFGEGCGGC